jgi:hypothetical protein
MGLYNVRGEEDQFQQYANDNVQQCYFAHEYEEKLNNDDY